MKLYRATFSITLDHIPDSEEELKAHFAAVYKRFVTTGVGRVSAGPWEIIEVEEKKDGSL